MGLYKRLLGKTLLFSRHQEGSCKIGTSSLLRSSSTVATPRESSSSSGVVVPPHLPEFDYVPKPYSGPSGDDVLRKRKEFLGHSLFHYYQKPLNIVEGKMQYLFDEESPPSSSLAAANRSAS